MRQKKINLNITQSFLVLFLAQPNSFPTFAIPTATKGAEKRD
jgi:hypothetical protein